MTDSELSYGEICAILEVIEKEVKADIENIYDLAESKDITIDVEFSDNFNKRVKKRFPQVEIFNSQITAFDVYGYLIN